MTIEAETALKIPVDCHHPGYQTITASSWWCDQCIGDLAQLETNENARSTEEKQFNVFLAMVNEILIFWDWFKPLAVHFFGAILSVAFVIVAYVIEHPIWKEDRWATKELQLNYLHIREERLRKGMDKIKSDMGVAVFYGDEEEFRELEIKLHNYEADLIRTIYKIDSLGSEIEEHEKWPDPDEADAAHKKKYAVAWGYPVN